MSFPKVEDVNTFCTKCKNFVDEADMAFDCYSKECPSTNKRIKIDSWGPDKTRTPTWVPT